MAIAAIAAQEQQTSQAVNLAPVRAQHNPGPVSPFSDIESWEVAQRMAKGLAYSSMIPDEFNIRRNPEAAISNCLIAMDVANSLSVKITTVMQNMYVVHGKPSFSASFMIARLNDSGRFSPLKFIWKLDKSGDKIGCHAEAKHLASGETLDGPEVTLEMAKAEGWGAKWKTMPEVMLRYRAAAFFIRLHASDVMMGFYSKEELEDEPAIVTATIEPAESRSAIDDLNRIASKNASESPKVFDVEPEPEKTKDDPAACEETGKTGKTDATQPPEKTPAPAEPGEKAPERAPEDTIPDFTPAQPQPRSYLKAAEPEKASASGKTMMERVEELKAQFAAKTKPRDESQRDLGI